MVIKYIIDYLMPHRCVDCMKLIETELSLCSDCWNKYIFIEEPWCDTCGRPFEIEIDSLCLACLHKTPPFSKSRSLLKFDEKSRLLIHGFKYHDKTYLGKFFASVLFFKHKALIEKADFITCVPMHKLKRLFRMYNHSHILARNLSKISGKDFIYDVLHKTKYTKPQTFLSKSDRKKNLNNSFACSFPEKVKGKNIILVDDVITTGTTINLCSKILKKAGASSVTVLSIAKNYM